MFTIGTVFAMFKLVKIGTIVAMFKIGYNRYNVYKMVTICAMLTYKIFTIGPKINNSVYYWSSMTNVYH